MSANKDRNTKPELVLRKALRANGLVGYRLHFKKLPGRPDISFVSKRVAIFVNGCFWHRCPYCNLPLPKSNTDWWKAKFEKNVERDKMKIAQLEDLGWKVAVVWECEIKKDVQKVVSEIQKIITC